MSKDLATSLKRMNTDHIDLFFVHAIRDADIMDSSMQAWAREQKAEGRIRLFGFSTHSNMEAMPAGRRPAGLDRRHHDDLQFQADA
jgi:predicted aldo/keto reductase-like oxidoreductase